MAALARLPPAPPHDLGRRVTMDEEPRMNGHANGINGHARRAQFGLHEEEEEDEVTDATVETEEVNLRHGFDYAESVLAEEEQLRTSTWLPWTDVRLRLTAGRMTWLTYMRSATASKRSLASPNPSLPPFPNGSIQKTAYAAPRPPWSSAYASATTRQTS